MHRIIIYVAFFISFSIHGKILLAYQPTNKAYVVTGPNYK